MRVLFCTDTYLPQMNGVSVVTAVSVEGLARAGWTDVMLIERAELTSGSSWHAAGGFHTLNADPNVAKLQAYTVGLYRELEELSGQSCSLHLTGGVMMAGTPERMDYLRLAHAKDVRVVDGERRERHHHMGDPALWGGLEYPSVGLGDLDHDLYLSLLQAHASGVPLILEHLDEADIPRAKAFLDARLAEPPKAA